MTVLEWLSWSLTILMSMPACKASVAHVSAQAVEGESRQRPAGVSPVELVLLAVELA
ncbi:MAG: hypothetical protein MUF83_20450 [Acidimicrobiales bacterium]|nr:hypothetical protein [Acidimicrobiales bacterium]